MALEESQLLEIVERFMSENNKRILRILLSNTTVEIKIKGVETTSFKSNIGAPQGDSYSGPQFTTYFESSLKTVRQEINTTMTEDYPEEMIYANDYDHLTEELEKKRLFKGK